VAHWLHWLRDQGSPQQEKLLNWNAPTLWWMVAGALVAVELATGTFYLLMLALGAAAGALAAHAGLGLTAQVVAAAVVGGGAVVAWHLKRAREPRAEPSQSNRDVNLDIGQTVHVQAWSSEGTARVPYRGATWSVRLASGQAHEAGLFVIVAVQGSELQVAPQPKT
jgi:membrane protein implicated in regulation of membrane protease activity